MSVFIKEVITNKIDGTNYIMLIDENNDKWVNVETLGEVCGYKQPKKSISNLFNRHREAFSNNVLFHLIGGKGRPRLFFNYEGVYRLKLYGRKFRESKEMDKLIEFLSEVDKGELKVIHQDDIQKLKSQLLLQNQTTQLLPELLGQILGPVVDHLIDRIDQKLYGDKTFDSQRAQIIQELIYRYSSWHDIPINMVWANFRRAFGVTGYRNAERKYFIPFLEYFAALDKRVVASVYNEYKDKSYKESEILNSLLSVLQGTSSQLSTLDKYT